MYLYAIDIHGVLVIATATHVVLTTHLIVLTYASKGNQQALDAATCSIGHQACSSYIHMVHGVGLSLDTSHGDFVEHLLVGRQNDIHANHVACGVELLTDSLVADHGIDECDGVLYVHKELVIAILVGGGTDGGVFFYIDVGQIHSAVVCVEHITKDAHFVSEERNAE